MPASSAVPTAWARPCIAATAPLPLGLGDDMWWASKQPVPPFELDGRVSRVIRNKAAASPILMPSRFGRRVRQCSSSSRL